MKLSFSVFGSLLFLSTLCCIANVEAGFSNSGRMQSQNLNLSIGGTLDNNGELIGIESAAISCDTLSGKGLISAPQISIKAKLFAYTGTIECNGKCVIVTNSPFDKKMFKQRGKGEFVIIVNKAPMEAVNCFADEYSITDDLAFQVE